MSERRIILVDDDIDFVNIIKSYFNYYGFNIIDFTDPLLALGYIRSNSRDSYSLIILDWKMPSMNGLILATNIRKFIENVKMIMITAYDISLIKILPEYESVKFEKIIQKPVRLSALKEAINELLTV